MAKKVATPKVSAPKTAKKAAPAATPATKKDGLRKGQVRILEFLAKAKHPAPRKTIAEKAPVDLANCVELIGSPDAEKRAANDVKHFPCLLSLGLVKEGEDEEHGRVYSITDKGRKALLSL